MLRVQNQLGLLMHQPELDMKLIHECVTNLASVCLLSIISLCHESNTIDCCFNQQCFFLYAYTQLMCLVIRQLIYRHVTVCSVCLCLLYACFNMLLIIGAVMCSFIIPITMKHSQCTVGVCVLSMKQIMAL